MSNNVTRSISRTSVHLPNEISCLQQSCSGGHSPESTQTYFWRNAIGVVMIPFVLTGIPVLSIVFTTGTDDQKRRFTTITWIKSILTDRTYLVVNLLSMGIALALNGWLFYLLFDLLIQLFILGQISDRFGSTVVEMLQTFPVVLLVDIFWLRGYRLKEMIGVLNRTMWPPGQTDVVSNTVKLSMVIGWCVAIHVINYATFTWKLKYGLNIETKNQYFAHLPHRLINTFAFPVYIALCMAIYSRNSIMNQMSKTLIGRSQPPDMIHLRQIKCHFKQNGQLIYHVNACFNLVMSVFVVVVVVWETLYLSFNLISTFFNYIAMAQKQDNHTQQALIRCLSAEALLILMKLSLIAITITQMFAVNHESRMAEIVINDQMSQLDRVVDRDLYTAYRLLRFYVKSRLDNTNRPNLLYINIFSLAPFLKSYLLIRIT